MKKIDYKPYICAKFCAFYSQLINYKSYICAFYSQFTNYKSYICAFYSQLTYYKSYICAVFCAFYSQLTIYILTSVLFTHSSPTTSPTSVLFTHSSLTTSRTPTHTFWPMPPPVLLSSWIQ